MVDASVLVVPAVIAAVVVLDSTVVVGASVVNPKPNGSLPVIKPPTTVELIYISGAEDVTSAVVTAVVLGGVVVVEVVLVLVLGVLVLLVVVLVVVVVVVLVFLVRSLGLDVVSLLFLSLLLFPSGAGEPASASGLVSHEHRMLLSLQRRVVGV